MSFADSITNSSVSGESAPADRLALLYNLSQTFNSSLDLDEVLNRVIDEVIVATRAERGFVMLRDVQGRLVFHVARGMDQSSIQDPVFQISLGIVEGVAKNGQPVLTGDAQIDPRFRMRQSVRLLGLRSILCVPLKMKEQILGTVYVDNRIQAGIFAQADLDLLSAIAYSAAIAIENARLYQLAIEKGRLERELQVARDVQASLLPRETPQFRGWEFVARWLPARQVAGDYYDFISGKDGRLGVVVADVSDKGMPAALFMTLTRSIIRASMDQAVPPMEGMSRANRLICEDSIRGMFVTLFYTLLEPAKNQMTFVNAGHNPPLFFQTGKRPGQGVLSHLDRTGMALGVEASTPYEQKALSFNRGDFVVLYTDGITDALNPQGQDFGLENLESIVLAEREQPAEQMARHLENELQSFIGEAPLFDDSTFVIVRRTR
jgi:sigma-B regulation protein RsbU (phosphoserine phosphatase)